MAPEDVEAVTGRMVDASKLVSATGDKVSSRFLSISRSSDSKGVGVFLKVPSIEKRALVGENNESLNTVSALEVVVDSERLDKRLEYLGCKGCGESRPAAPEGG